MSKGRKTQVADAIAKMLKENSWTVRDIIVWSHPADNAVNVRLVHIEGIKIE